VASVFPREVKDGGENRVRNDDQERRLHYCTGSGATNGVGTAVNTKAFQTSNLRNNGPEDNALDEPHNYVAQVDCLEHIMEVQNGCQGEC
jgi:hypothetical protein